MEMKQLEYFKTVAEEGNISAAAKKLHISQPPLSMQMKHLEEELHVRLFERGARSITLTEAGKILYERAKAILEMASAGLGVALVPASAIEKTKHTDMIIKTIGSPALNSCLAVIRKKGDNTTGPSALIFESCYTVLYNQKVRKYYNL